MENLEEKVIMAQSGTHYALSSVAGQGAQGIVYDTTDNQCVVKLYKHENELKDRKKLKKLEWLMAISTPDQFIRPVDIFNEPYIGYAMKKVLNHISLNKLLFPNRDMSFSDWYNSETGGLYRRLYLGYKIAMQFSQLHKKNLAYCDISGSNILVNKDKKIASVCMIDIDNIYIPGDDDVNVLGTSRYMAPEILTRQCNPDIFTDSYSLAVILFELLRVGHPYIGDLVEDGTPEQMTEAYKGFYPYVDDASTDINRSSQMLPAEVVFTTELKNLFAKTFVDGKENRLERTRAHEFALALLKATNLLVKCKKCNNWHYAAPNVEHKYLCPWCDAEYEKPLRLAFYDKYVCKKNDRTISLKDRHICDYILKTTQKNVLTKNYVADIYAENEKKSIEPYCCIRLGKDKNFYVVNDQGLDVFVQVAGVNHFVSVEKGSMQEINKGDTLLFRNPSKLSYEYLDGNIQGVSFRYAVVR